VSGRNIRCVRQDLFGDLRHFVSVQVHGFNDAGLLMLSANYSNCSEKIIRLD
jgi:hypothetical protein